MPRTQELLHLKRRLVAAGLKLDPKSRAFQLYRDLENTFADFRYTPYENRIEVERDIPYEQLSRGKELAIRLSNLLDQFEAPPK